MNTETSEMEIEGIEKYDSHDIEVPEEIELGMYAKPDEFFYTDSSMDSWLYFEGDDSELVMNQLVNQPDPLETIGLLAGYVDDFGVEDKDDSYLLKLDASEDEFTELKARKPIPSGVG